MAKNWLVVLGAAAGCAVVYLGIMALAFLLAVNL